MKGAKPRIGFLKCGRGYVRKTKIFPGDAIGIDPLHKRFSIRQGEANDVDTRSYGYKGEVPVGSGICSLENWDDINIKDEQDRNLELDRKRTFTPIEELMIADVDGRPFCVMGDDIVDEVRDIEDSLVEALDEETFITPHLKPGKILAWHYPHPWGPEGPDGSGLFLGNHGKISTTYGEVAVFYKRRKVLPAKPPIEPGKKPPPGTHFPQPPPKKMGLGALGSLLHSKRMPQLHQIAMMAKR